MKFVRRVVRKTRRNRIRNERIREEAGQKKAMNVVAEECQLKWYGHAGRMGEERNANFFFEMQVEGRAGRVRPRITWEDRIRRIGQKRGKTLTEMKRMSVNRSEWRKWIERGYPDA